MRLRHLMAALAAVLVASGTAAVVAPVAASAAVVVTPLPSGFKAIQVDPVTKRAFVSSPVSSIVTVLNEAGGVVGSLSVPGAGALVIDGPTLYVASTTAGRIDAFDTTTLAKVGTFGGGALLKPTALVKAGGRLWTTTGACSSIAVQLVSIAPATGVVTTYPALPDLSYCPYLFTSATDPNVMLGFDVGLSPATVVRLDVSGPAPMVTATLRTDSSNARSAEVLPDGQTFALAAGAPYEIRTFGVNPLQPHGVVYDLGPYPNGVTATAAAGGLLAASRDAYYENDINVFRLGDPSDVLFRYDFGTYNDTALDDGLAFSADGTRLLVVSGRDSQTNLNIFDLADSGGRYHPLTPSRVLDTRTGVGGLPGPVGAGSAVDMQITGRGGVPATGVSAVAMNVTVTQPTAAGYLTIYPTGTPRPLAANLNFTPGKTVPNLVVVKLGTNGRASLYNSAGDTHVIYDVAGWYSDPSAGRDGRYTAVLPSRILDTRNGTGGGVRLSPGTSLDLQVRGRGGLPAIGVAAAVLNVAAADPSAPSFLTVYPTGEERPLAANLNFGAGDTVSNRTIVKLGTSGKVTIYNYAGSTDIVVDVNGWFSDASGPTTTGTSTAVAPARILDTRDGTGGVSGPLLSGTSAEVQVTGRGGVPLTGVRAVILNATVVDPTGPGFLTVYPILGSRPLASDLNYATGEIRPNLVVVQVGPGGKIVAYSATTAHVVFDVAGWIA